MNSRIDHTTHHEASSCALALEGASFTYDGEHFVFEGLDLRIEQGEFVCIVGGNGSGKSTIAKHVNGLLLPDEGSVRVFGRSTQDPRAVFFVRGNAGLVFQNPDDQIVASIVEKDVAFGLENLGIPSEEIAARVKAALEEVGLQGFEKHETTALSGGQKQRVAIAGVLAMEPNILVLDEASSMLDPRGRAGLMRVCRALHQQGMTIIMITHFMEEAAQAERVIVLEHGAVRLDDTPAHVFAKRELLERLNLEMPFAARLSLLLQDQGSALPTCITDVELEEALCPLRSNA